MQGGIKQVTLLSQRGRAMLRVLDYFAKSLSAYWYSIETMSASRTVYEIFSVKE